MVDAVSTVQSMASRGSSFKASIEFAVAITGGFAAKLADVLMAALGLP
jgi:hypothetical protein